MLDWKLTTNRADTHGIERFSGRALFLLTSILCVLLIGYGFRKVLPDPTLSVPGCELDTINYVWGIWWSYAQAMSPEGLLGPDRFNLYPVGVQGMILAPLSAILVWPFLWWKGAVFAYNVAWVFNLILLACGVAFLTRRICGSWKAACLAAIAILAARPPFFDLSMGQLHGATAGWVAFGAAMWWGCSSHWRAFLGGLLMSVALVESPYAVIPVALACLVFGGYGVFRALKNRSEKSAWVVRLTLGAAGVLLLALPFSMVLMSSSAPVDSITMAVGTNRLEAVSIPIFDLPSRQFRWTDVGNPFSRPPEAGEARRFIAWGGRNYLGVVALLLSLLLPSSRRWLLVAAFAVLMAAGSMIRLGDYQILGPFAFVNYLLSRILAPLTMPDLLLVYAAMAVAVAAGIGATRVARGSWWGWAALLSIAAADGLAFGGPSMVIGTVSADGGDCLARVFRTHPGAVHLVDHEHCITRQSAPLMPGPLSGEGAESGVNYVPPAVMRRPDAHPGTSLVTTPVRAEGPDARPGSSFFRAAGEGDMEPCPAERKRGQLLQAIHGQPYTDVCIVRRWQPLGPVPENIAELSNPVGPICLWFWGREVETWEWTAPVEWIIVNDPEKKLGPGPLGQPVTRCEDYLVFRRPAGAGAPQDHD